MTKQFLSHTDLAVIDQAVKTISHFVNTSLLSTTNETKISALEETLVSNLRECVEDKDIQSAAFEEEELRKLGAVVVRIDKLFAVRDLSTVLEDKDEGEGSVSAWDILDSVAERARLGYKDEELVRLLLLVVKSKKQELTHTSGIYRWSNMASTFSGPTFIGN